MSARDRILARVRAGIADRERVAHPGDFGGWRPGRADASSGSAPDESPAGAATGSRVEALTDMLDDAGAEFIHLPGHTAASRWARDFAKHFASVAIGRLARFPMAYGASEGPRWIEPADPAEAELGVSLALGAVAETGSLILGAQEERRVQLLPPVHLVWLEEGRIFATLRDALAELRRVVVQDLFDETGVDLDAEFREGLPSAIGLHSGPSKSADLGQILVKGVHGPGRLVVLIVGDGP